jgi:hypothetical protein
MQFLFSNIQGTSRKFMIKNEYYDLKVVNSILFNQKTKLVSIFKDYLIFDDICEFLQGDYTIDQSRVLFKQAIRIEKERQSKFKSISNYPSFGNCNKDLRLILFKNRKLKQRAVQDKLKILK